MFYCDYIYITIIIINSKNYNCNLFYCDTVYIAIIIINCTNCNCNMFSCHNVYVTIINNIFKDLIFLRNLMKNSAI